MHDNPHSHAFDYSQWRPPPYKSHYSNTLLTYAKPLMVIHNKYAKEWNGPPVNFIDIPTLLKLAEVLKADYQVVYVRPELQTTGYAQDQSDILEFNDHAA